MDGDECETETFLNDLDSKYHASAAGLIRLIEQITESGLDGLSTKQFHLVDAENKIYELIKGDIRLLCFKGHANLLIVTTHAFIKKTQKTPENDKNKAIRHKKKVSAGARPETNYFGPRSGGITWQSNLLNNCLQMPSCKTTIGWKKQSCIFLSSLTAFLNKAAWRKKT